MKAHLLYRDHDFDLQQKYPLHGQALTQDLEVGIGFVQKENRARVGVQVREEQQRLLQSTPG